MNSELDSNKNSHIYMYIHTYSELFSRNKVTAYNTFALPVLTMSIGVLDWSEQELMSPDIKARKNLNISGSIHSKGDANRLYVSRSNGGRGLNSVIDMFKNRMVNLSNYLKQVHNNPMLEIVKIKELDNIRIGESVKEQYSPGEDHGKDYIKNKIKNIWKRNIQYMEKKSNTRIS